MTAMQVPVDDRRLVQEAAERYRRCGLSVTPIRVDGSKGAFLTGWPSGISGADFDGYFRNPNARLVGVGIVAGAVSGNLQILDFDNKYGWVYPDWVQRLADIGLGDLVASIPIVQSPSGGRHLYYRVLGSPARDGGLAATEDRKPLIELNGNACVCNAPGCPPSVHPSGGLYRWVNLGPEHIPALTEDHRIALIACSREFNRYIKPVQEPRPRPAGVSQYGQSPIDAYNETDACLSVLQDHGWKLTKRVGDVTYLVRPGKSDFSKYGTSATWNYGGSHTFTNFSSNAAPFEPNETCSPFWVYCLLEHGGDKSAARSALLARGYSDQPDMKNGANSHDAPVAHFRDEDAPPDSSDGHYDVPGVDDLELVAPIETPRRGPGRPKKGTSEDTGNRPSEYALAVDWAASVEGQWLYVEGDQWWHYDQNRWHYASSAGAIRCLQEFLVERMLDGERVTPKPTLIRNILFLAQSMLGPIPVDRFDSHPTWIALQNGIYDTQTGNMREHDPKHLLTRLSPFEYDKSAECPLWKKFLTEVIITESGERCYEWLLLLQEWFGYSLVPGPCAQTSMFWVGDGGNGKGVATRVLERLAGPDNCTSIPIENLHEPYHRADLQGKLVGFVNEPDPKSMVKNGTHFKAVVGGDSINARRPTEKVFSFKPQIRVIVSCNELPKTRDLSHGYFRRVKLIEWRYKVPDDKNDPLLDIKLHAELPGIFNWAMLGLKRFDARGRLFQECGESRKLLSEYRIQEDPFARFLLDMWESCDPETAEPVPVSYLYKTYVTWSNRNGERFPMPNAVFGRKLGKMGFVKKVARVDDGTGSNKVPTNVWIGLKLREAANVNDNVEI
jgi:P4 family phage/plasmid primase-like protien